MGHKILVINPGSTSTKIALFDDCNQIFITTIRYSADELEPYARVIEQLEFRKSSILEALKQSGIDISDVELIMGRGGLVKPIESGVYEVNEAMLKDLRNNTGGEEHASNLGAIIADDFAKEIGCKAYIADPVVVDELQPVARITGHPLFEWRSVFHALNHKIIAKRYANSVNSLYENLNLIVAHLGGGVSVGAHMKGRVVDVNNALSGVGPFSPERSGYLPAYDLAKVCFSGDYSFDEVKRMINGDGGLVAHLGTNSFQEVAQKMREGDVKVALVLEAFLYNVAKAIGAAAVVFSGKVDAILITGGIAYNTDLMEHIAERVRFIAPVKIYPGEDEMFALAENGYRVLIGEEIPSVY